MFHYSVNQKVMQMQEFSGCARRKDTFFDFLLLLDFLQFLGWKIHLKVPHQNGTKLLSVSDI